MNTFYENLKKREIKLSEALYPVKKEIAVAPKKEIKQPLMVLNNGKKSGP